LADLLTRLRLALADRYTIDGELGRGGMATVYLARDLKHDRRVALKVLHAELAAALGQERFHREIMLAARLQHPHILTVLDSGEAAGQLWFTMPFVEGESLRDRLNREKQLPVEDALRIAREAAEALDYAHRSGVLFDGHHGPASGPRRGQHCPGTRTGQRASTRPGRVYRDDPGALGGRARALGTGPAARPS
jgi:hypothetical protein